MSDRQVKVEIDIPISQPQARLRALGREVGDLTSKWDRLAQSQGGQHLQAGLTATSVALAAMIGAAILEAARFELAMSNVRAATRATATEMQQLSEAAIAIGKQGKYSAVEVADAMAELGRAGLSAAQILGGGLKAALDLAAAGQFGVGKAAELAASAMTQFKLKAEDLSHVADLLAATAGKAQGSVEDAGMALQQAGVVAAQAGLSIEETTAAIAAMASAGLVGSDAGTSLKTMLQRLTAPTQESAQLMHDLGINAFDASGKFVGLAAFAGQLHGSLRKLTDQQRNAALATIFGSDAIRAAGVLYDQSLGGMNDWIDKVNDQGFAQSQAAIQTDNLTSDLAKLKGVIVGSLIDAGGNATGVLRGLTQVLTFLASTFASLPAPVAVTVGSLMLLVAAAAAVAKIWMTVGPAFTLARAAAAGLGAEMLAVVLKSNLASAAFMRLTAASYLLGPALRVVGAAAGILTVVGLIASAIISMTASAEDAAPPVEGLSQALAHLAASGKLSGEAAQVYGANLGALSYQVKAAIATINTGIKDGSLDKSWNKIFGGDAGADAMQHALEGITALKGATAGLDAELAKMVQGGDMATAVAAFAKIKTTLLASGVPLDKLNLLFPLFNQAMLDTAGAVPELVNGFGQFQTQTDLAEHSLSDFLSTGLSVLDLFNQLNGAAVSQARAWINTQQKIADLKATLDANGTSMDANTDSGRKNLGAVLDLAEAYAKQADAMKKNGESNASISEWWQRQRDVLHDLLAEQGLEEGQIQALLDLYFKFPYEVKTTVSSNADAVNGKIKGLMDGLNNLPGTKTINIITRYSSTGNGPRGQQNEHWGFADGGLVEGRGGPREDAIPARLSNGEFVSDAEATRGNRALLEMINASAGRNILADIMSAPMRHAAITVTPPPAAAAPTLDPDVIARVVRGALAGMTVTMDGRVVGAMQGRTADIYRRTGG